MLNRRFSPKALGGSCAGTGPGGPGDRGCCGHDVGGCTGWRYASDSLAASSRSPTRALADRSLEPPFRGVDDHAEDPGDSNSGSALTQPCCDNRRRSFRLAATTPRRTVPLGRWRARAGPKVAQYVSTSVGSSQDRLRAILTGADIDRIRSSRVARSNGWLTSTCCWTDCEILYLSEPRFGDNPPPEFRSSCL
jgi:hypothetical protein